MGRICFAAVVKGVDWKISSLRMRFPDNDERMACARIPEEAKGPLLNLDSC